MIFLKSYKWLCILCAGLCGLSIICGCSHILSYWSDQETASPAQEQEPRILASLQLTEQGQALLEEKNVDDAIRLLERAISLDPQNGESYYYLAEAWLLKGNTSQAIAYNRLADIYLNEKPYWISRISDQRARIEDQDIGDIQVDRNRDAYAPASGIFDRRGPRDRDPATSGMYLINQF